MEKMMKEVWKRNYREKKEKYKCKNSELKITISDGISRVYNYPKIHYNQSTRKKFFL